MAYAKLSRLLIELIQRTSKGSLKWEGTAADGVYQMSFPKYTVQLSTRPAERDGFDDIVLTVLNSEGVVIEQAADPDFAPDVGEAYTAMKEMYATARRQALGVDSALDDLLSELTKEDVPKRW
jgi:hypothetical protein